MARYKGEKDRPPAGSRQGGGELMSGSNRSRRLRQTFWDAPVETNKKIKRDFQEKDTT